MLNTDTAVLVSLSCPVTSSGLRLLYSNPLLQPVPPAEMPVLRGYMEKVGGSPIATLSTLCLSQPLRGSCQWCFSQCPSQARPSCLERPSQEHVAAEGAHPSRWFERASRALPCQPGRRQPSQAVSMKKDLCGASMGHAPPWRAYACSISALSLQPCSGLPQCW